MMITILLIVIILILLVFFVGIFFIWKRFNPLIRKIIDNLNKTTKISSKNPFYGNNMVMKQQIKEIQDFIKSKSKK